MQLKRIAVTGGIACGKSTAAQMLRELGGEILDTDDVAHEVEGPGGEAVEAIAKAFGKEVVAADGSVDRRALSAKVFGKPDALSLLNSIVHPVIGRRVDEWLNGNSEGKFKAVLIPLLFEVGMDRSMNWDATVAVVCSAENQFARLLGRGHSANEAKARIASQMSCAEKAEKADYAIWNDGGFDDLRKEVSRVVTAILEK